MSFFRNVFEAFCGLDSRTDVVELTTEQVQGILAGRGQVRFSQDRVVPLAELFTLQARTPEATETAAPAPPTPPEDQQLADDLVATQRAFLRAYAAAKQAGLAIRFAAPPMNGKPLSEPRPITWVGRRHADTNLFSRGFPGGPQS